MQNIHTRIPEADYKKISEICGKLNITFADYFNRAIKANGYDELQRYARKIKKEPRPCKIEMSDGVKESIDNLVDTMNGQSMQIRRIGTNLSNMIAKGSNHGTDITASTLTTMKKELDAALLELHKNSSRLADILYDESSITKTEYRGYDAWDDDDWNEDWGEL